MIKEIPEEQESEEEFSVYESTDEEIEAYEREVANINQEEEPKKIEINKEEMKKNLWRDWIRSLGKGTVSIPKESSEEVKEDVKDVESNQEAQKEEKKEEALFMSGEAVIVEEGGNVDDGWLFIGMDPVNSEIALMQKKITNEDGSVCYDRKEVNIEELKKLNESKFSEEEKEKKEFSEICEEIKDFIEKNKKIRGEEDDQKNLMERLKNGPTKITINLDYKMMFLMGIKAKEKLDFFKENNPSFEINEETEEMIEDFLRRLKKETDILGARTEEKVSNSNEKAVKDQENLNEKRKTFLDSAKKFLKNKNVQFVVGMTLAGVAIAAPPTGFAALVTMGAFSGFVPAALGSQAAVLTGIAGGWIGSGAVKDIFNKARNKEVVEIEKNKK